MKARSTLVFLAAVSLANAAFAEQLLAIYPLQSRELSPQEARELDEVLRWQAQYLTGIILQSRAKVKRASKRVVGQRKDCERRLDCLVEVGELSAANLMIAGSASRLEQAYRLDLKLIDISKEKIVNRAQADIGGDARSVAAGVQDLLGRLLQRDQFSGVLHVRTQVRGAHVLLDDLEIGVTPMDPVPSLKPRSYSLSIVLDGCEPYQAPVQIWHATITKAEVEVVDKRLRVQVSQQPLETDHPLPPDAELVAERLRTAAPPTPPPPPLPPEEAEHDVVVAHAGAEPTDPAPEADPGLSTSKLAGILLSSGGAVFTVAGAVGLVGYGLGAAAAAGTVRDGVIVDRDGYLKAQDDRDLYTGLGLAGAVIAPIGLAMITGGFSLYRWELLAGLGSE